MKKALTIVGLFIGINATAQISTTSTNNNSGVSSQSAIGLQTTASGVASTAMGRETEASGINSSRVMSFFIFLNLTQFLVQSK